MRIKNFRQLFFAKQYPKIYSGSSSESSFKASIDIVVPYLAVLGFHIMEVPVRLHRDQVPVPYPLQDLFKLCHGM